MRSNANPPAKRSRHKIFQAIALGGPSGEPTSASLAGILASWVSARPRTLLFARMRAVDNKVFEGASDDVQRLAADAARGDGQMTATTNRSSSAGERYRRRLAAARSERQRALAAHDFIRALINKLPDDLHEQGWTDYCRLLSRHVIRLEEEVGKQ
jgi:hypothetical protein